MLRGLRLLRLAPGLMTATTTPIKPLTTPKVLALPAGCSTPSEQTTVKAPTTFYRVACESFQAHHAARLALRQKVDYNNLNCFADFLSNDLIVARGADEKELLDLFGAQRVTKLLNKAV